MNNKKQWVMPRQKRNRLAIRRWMLDQEPEVTVTGIGKELGINYTVVSNTLADRRNDEKVLMYLYQKGCPLKYLALPARLEVAARKAA